MTGFGNPFTEIPIAIFESLKRTVTRREKCFQCENKDWLHNFRRDFLGRFECKDRENCYFRKFVRFGDTPTGGTWAKAQEAAKRERETYGK
jgi:hypothetical protein